MELWIEGTVQQVIDAAQTGLVTAIATNPSIIARWTADGQSLEQVVSQVCEEVDIPVYVQLHGGTVNDFLREMDTLHDISAKIQPKLVATHAGIKATKQLASAGFKPLVTTIATVPQAFLAASVGASYIAPYIGRIVDAGVDAYQLITEISAMYQKHDVQTQIAVASIHNNEQATKSVLAGAPIVVMPYEVYTDLLFSELTTNWIERFEQDWQKIPHQLGKET